MPGATGDFPDGHASVQVQRHATVPQVVKPQYQRRVNLGGREGFLAGELPDPPVAALAEQPAPCAAVHVSSRAVVSSVKVNVLPTATAPAAYNPHGSGVITDTVGSK